eukprot:s2504_g3.t3
MLAPWQPWQKRAARGSPLRLAPLALVVLAVLSVAGTAWTSFGDAPKVNRGGSLQRRFIGELFGAESAEETVDETDYGDEEPGRGGPYAPEGFDRRRMQLEIVRYPHPSLREQNEEIKVFDRRLRTLADNLFDTLYATGDGIGLAAPQVGVNLRVMVYNPDPRTRDEETVFVNPRIISFSDDKDWQAEGCLSFPRIRGNVQRPVWVEVEVVGSSGAEGVLPGPSCPSGAKPSSEHALGAFTRQRMTRTAYWKALAVTTATTYPYALLVSKLSRIQLSEFKPCSARACTFIKIFGSGMVPTTFDRSWEDAPWCSPWPPPQLTRIQVRNGDTNHSRLSHNFLEPLCPSFSLRQMQQECNGEAARHSIINPLHNSRSRHAYVWCIGGWWLSKILHDWLLLAGAHEYTTLRIGLVSTFFHLLAVCAAFLWSMGAVEVFLSPMGNGECACYYVLPELESIFAIGTPCLLFITAVRKLENVHRAPLVGDYLYYQQYDAPYRLVNKSNGVSTGTLLVSSACGYHAEAWYDQLNIDQLRGVYACHQILCYVVFLGDLYEVVSICVGIGIGPVSARSIELILNTSAGGWVLNVLLALVMAAIWCFPAFLIFRLVQSLPIDWMAMRPRPELWEYHSPRTNLAVRVTWVVFLASCLIWASWVLSSPMMAKMCNQFYIFGSREAYLSALAGILYFAFGVQMFVWIVYLVPAHRALYVKARMPFRPSAYVEIGNAHPEFNLESEVELAYEFLKENRNPESLEWIEGWEERWKDALSWEDSKAGAYQARDSR